MLICLLRIIRKCIIMWHTSTGQQMVQRKMTQSDITNDIYCALKEFSESWEVEFRVNIHAEIVLTTPDGRKWIIRPQENY